MHGGTVEVVVVVVIVGCTKFLLFQKIHSLGCALVTWMRPRPTAEKANMRISAGIVVAILIHLVERHTFSATEGMKLRISKILTAEKTIGLEMDKSDHR